MDEGNVEYVSYGLTTLFILEKTDLSNCTSLNLHGNVLADLRGIPRMPKLTELIISSNKFTNCNMPELSLYSSLVRLDLSSNMLSSVVFSPPLPQLRSLLLGSNTLTSINGLDYGCPNLADLDIRDNRIESVDDLETALSGLHFLVTLSLARNPVCSTITKMSQIFRSCPSLYSVEGFPKVSWLSVEADFVPTPRFDQKLSNFRMRLEEQHHQQHHQQQQQQQLMQQQLLQQQNYQQLQHVEFYQEKQLLPFPAGSPFVAAVQPANEPGPSEWSTSLMPPSQTEELQASTFRGMSTLCKCLSAGHFSEYQSVGSRFYRWRDAARELRTAAVARKELQEALAGVEEKHASEVAALNTRIEQLLSESLTAIALSEQREAESQKYLAEQAAQFRETLEATRSELTKDWSDKEAAWLEASQALQAENAQLREEVSSCAASIDSINSMVALQRDQVRVSHANEVRAEQQLAASQSEVHSLRESNAAANQLVARLRDENASLRSALIQEEESKRVLSEALAISNAHLTTVRAELSHTQAQTTTSKAPTFTNRDVECELLRQENEALQQNATRLETRVAKLAGAVKTLRDRCDELSEEQELKESEWRDRQSKLESEKAALGKDVRTLQEIAEQRKSSETRAQKYKSKVLEQMSLLSRQEQQLGELRRQVDDLTAAVETLESAKRDLSDKQVHQSVILHSQQEVLSDSQRMSNRLREENDRLKAEMRKAAEDAQLGLSVKDKVVEDKMLEIEQQGGRLRQARAELEAALAANAELERQLEAAEEAAAVQEEKLAVLDRKNLGLAQMLFEMHSSRQHGGSLDEEQYRDILGEGGAGDPYEGLSLSASAEWKNNIH